jgi:hypothetical protein
LFLFFIALLGLLPQVARAETEVVIVGVHLPQQSERAAQRTTEQMVSVVDRQSGLKAIAPEVIRARVRGQGDQILDQALTGRGRAMLAEGRILFEQADLEGSLVRLTDAVGSLESAMAGTTESRHLVDALLLVGMVQLSMGQADAARQSYKRVLRLDPARELDTVHYPPKVVNLFQEVRGAVLAAPRASIMVQAKDPKARVYVDGRLRGQGRVMVDDLITGPHHVLVSADSGHRNYTVVDVVPGSQKLVTARLTRRFVGLAAETDTLRSRQVAELYKALGDRVTGGLVLLGGELSPSTVGLQIFEPRTGNFSRILTAASGGDSSAALVSLAAQVSGFLNQSGVLRADQVGGAAISVDIGANSILAQVLLETQPEEQKPQPRPLPPQEKVARERHGTPWYIWAGVGVLALGATGVAFGLQGDSSTGTGGGDGGGTKTKTSDTGTVVVLSP